MRGHLEGTWYIHDGQNNATINIAVSHQSKRNYNNHNQSTQRMTAVRCCSLLTITGDSVAKMKFADEWWCGPQIQ